MLTSSRRGLSYPNPATRADSADVPRDINTIIAALELDVVYSQGTHANRPAAGAGAPAGTGGGRFYWETDTSQLFYDNGAAWVGPINATTIANGSITLAMLAANSVDASKIVDGSVGAAEIADGSVGTAEIAAALKPSGGAGAATEALRALGSAAGQAAPGNDARFRTEIVGHVNANASVAQGTGFTVGFSGSATYNISFNVAFAAAPIVLAQQVGATCTISNISTTCFTVTTQGATTGEFYFRAILPF